MKGLHMQEEANLLILKGVTSKEKNLKEPTPHKDVSMLKEARNGTHLSHSPSQIPIGSRGGGGGSRRNVSFREDNQNTSDMNDLQQGERNPIRPSFEPFCENPEDTRRRMERRRLNKQFRNKGYQSSSAADVGSEDTSNNSSSSYAQKSSTKTNKHSGKQWRQGAQESDDASGRRIKKTPTTEKHKTKIFRHKMIHKNEQRRNAAQAKYRNNF
ncbi:hypothetical protein Anas_13395 [Armadillidium nasatum]|uniref:Uncharacterized protein n=1 Tax=Armadillidium nasatum TaxID=96803 RepID=A0A5N5T0L5_9CRUS|nr:hypothetical protein Anas_13395 [Armadillidium nasatum]